MSDGVRENRNEQCTRRQRWWLWSALALIATLALASFDVPLARLCAVHPAPKFIVSTLEVVAAFGNGVGVVLVLALCVMLDRSKLSRLPLLISLSLGSGLIADIVKLCVFRMRPHSVDLFSATFGSTFHGWFPLLSAGSGGQSFPSAHAATVVGLAIALGVFYPQGRWVFAALAAVISIYRIVVGVHFPTDVATGVLIGGVWSYVCLHGPASSAFVLSEKSIDRLTNKRDAEFAAQSFEGGVNKRNAA